MIIAIEGTDAAGKATQSRMLAQALGGTRFAFPDYETLTGRAILGHLKKEWSAGYLDETESLGTTFVRRATCDPLVFQCLQTVNRLELLPAILAAGRKGPVVFDRYWASGVVYGKLDGLDATWLERMHATLPQPDVWILLDVPIDEGFKRRPERRDRYEADREYLERVRLEYLRLFNDKARGQRGSEWPHMEKMNAPCWHIIDGLGTADEVHARVLRRCLPATLT